MVPSPSEEEAVAEIVLEDVTKVYGDGTTAVADLNLDVRDGEFIVLVGPSGCGKTTALRMVAGLESISDGTIRIGDRVVNTVPPKERDIAMVFQNYALYPHMSVYDNMAFGLRLRKLSKTEIDRRVREAAESWVSRSTSSASPRPCPAGSGSGSPWDGRSSVNRRRS